jgi:SAM-dependent methyltransferase
MTAPVESDLLRAEIARLGPWHHDVEVAPGIWTGAMVRPAEDLERILDHVYPDGLEGRSFLDCACNAGGYVFAAARAGAGAGFGFDVREHWIAQAHFLARHLPSTGLEFAVHDLYDIPGLRREPADVTLFKGILYHLPDPITGLRIAADLTRELLIVNTATVPGPDGALMVNVESDADPMSGVHRLAWLPTGPSVVEQMLAWCGFPHTQTSFYDEQARHAPSGRGRMEILAARSPETLPRRKPAGRLRRLRARAGW